MKKAREKADHITGRNAAKQPSKKKSEPELPPGARFFLGLFLGFALRLLVGILGSLLGGG